MINYRIKDFDTPPKELIIGAGLSALKKAIKDKSGKNFKGNHYNVPKVTAMLKAYSLGKTTYNEKLDEAKCYYCESTSEVVASLQVEHYRPKVLVHNMHRKVIANPGYYWLGIEWTNLVLSCPKCNGKGAKGNIFTITGKHVPDGDCFDTSGNYDRTESRADQLPLVDENPDLLHPEIDDSYLHIKFENTGGITHKTNRGEASIQICKLDRKQLVLARLKLIREFKTKFLSVQALGEMNANFTDDLLFDMYKLHCEELKANFKREKAYTLLSRYMIEEFESFFVAELLPRYQNVIRKAFNSII